MSVAEKIVALEAQVLAAQRLATVVNQECDACRVKPGSPSLCSRCLEIRYELSEFYKVVPDLKFRRPHRLY